MHPQSEIDVKSCVLPDPIEKTNSGSMACVCRQSVECLCEHVIENHCFRKVSGIDSLEDREGSIVGTVTAVRRREENRRIDMSAVGIIRQARDP